MDVFDQHVYADNSSLPPSMPHAASTTIAEGDYGKLVSLLGRAFDGTKQDGSTLPIVYGEYGVETDVASDPQAGYTGNEVVATVDVQTQARYYRRAIELAACQKNVRALDFFHVLDEQGLAGLQSGLYYLDGTAKPSAETVRGTPVTCQS
jgi:hypothetical protein